MLALIITLSILAVVVFCLNTYCIVPIVRTKRLRKPSHLAICSLLYAHIVQSVLVIPAYAVKRSETFRDKSVCDIFRFSYLFTNYIACLSLLIITLDRVFGVLYPLQYPSKITSKRMMKCLIVMWIYVFLLSLIPFFPSRRNSSCTYIPQKEWTVFMLLANTFIPFLVIILSYVIIFKKAVSIMKVRYQKNASRFQRRRLSHFNKSKMTFVFVACFLICWGPGFFYYFIQAVCPSCFSKSYKDSKTEEVLTFTMKLLTFIDGVLAPLIYCFMNARFQTESRKHWGRSKGYSVKKAIIFTSKLRSDSNFSSSNIETLLSSSVGSDREIDMKNETRPSSVFHLTLNRNVANKSNVKNHVHKSCYLLPEDASDNKSFNSSSENMESYRKSCPYF